MAILLNMNYHPHHLHPKSPEQVAKQAAVMIGQVARTDLPNQSRDLIPSLLEVRLSHSVFELSPSHFSLSLSQQLQSPDSLVQRRSMLFLHHIAKGI